MFDISFGELFLVLVIGLVVLGPQRLPVAVKTIMRWIRTMRSLADSVQAELANELKLQELKDSINKVEQLGNTNHLTPELRDSIERVKEVAQSIQNTYYNAQSSLTAQEKIITAPPEHRVIDIDNNHQEECCTEAENELLIQNRPIFTEYEELPKIIDDASEAEISLVSKHKKETDKNNQINSEI